MTGILPHRLFHAIKSEKRYTYYIPFGKVTLLQGDHGDSKSKLILSLAALLSKGAPLPFANQCGYINTGVVPEYAGCVNGVRWFKDRGQ